MSSATDHHRQGEQEYTNGGRYPGQYPEVPEFQQPWEHIQVPQVSLSLSSVFQSYFEGLQPASRNDKQYGLALFLQFLTEEQGQPLVQALMDSDDPDAWSLLTRDNLEAFIL